MNILLQLKQFDKAEKTIKTLYKNKPPWLRASRTRTKRSAHLAGKHAKVAGCGTITSHPVPDPKKGDLKRGLSLVVESAFEDRPSDGGGQHVFEGPGGRLNQGQPASARSESCCLADSPIRSVR